MTSSISSSKPAAASDAARLPLERALSSGRSQGPRAGLAALALVALVELLVWKVSGLPPYLARFAGVGPEGDPLRIHAMLSRPPPKGLEVVAFVGTSQVARGLNEDAARAGSGGRVYVANLGISGGTPSDYLRVVRELDVLGPKTVLVSFLETQVNDAPKREFTDLSATLEFARFLGVKILAADAADGTKAQSNLTQGPFFALMPTLSYRRGILDAGRNYISAAVSERTLFPTPLAAEPRVERQRPGAAQLEAANAERGRATHWSELQWWAADRVFAVLRASGRRVLYVAMPRHPAYEKTLDPEARVEFGRRLVELRQRHGVDSLDVDASSYTEADFYDLVHFTPVAARRFSEALGRTLAHPS